ncbi:Periplasmic copper-binding protein (NosD) [Candidatus Methanoperedenaceae archaeon GB37]|nr:Periplasmic copper-binding protein (NosD) [Candidatus Methanoperedenaceae archaeon GB37]
MIAESSRGRNLRTAVGITTLTILFMLASAGTALGARWIADDSSGADVNYTTIQAVDAGAIPPYEDARHQHHLSSFDLPPSILHTPAPERRRARALHTPADPPEEEWKKAFSGSDIELGEPVKQTSDGCTIAGWTGSYDAGLTALNYSGDLEGLEGDLMARVAAGAKVAFYSDYKSISDTSKTSSGLSYYADALSAEGYTVEQIYKPITTSKLDGYDALLIIGLDDYLSESEINATEDFVINKSKGLLVSGGAIGPMKDLLSRFTWCGVHIDGRVICDPTDYEVYKKWIIIKNFEEHPITENVSAIVMYKSTIMNTPLAFCAPYWVVAWPDNDSWLDENGNYEKDSFEEEFVYTDGWRNGSIATSLERVVAIMDSNVFDNSDADGDGIVAFNEYDNDVLGLNIVKWLVGEEEDEIKFRGTAIEYFERIGARGWNVNVDEVISGPSELQGRTVKVYLASVDPNQYPPGYMDPNIEPGDEVEVYGLYQGEDNVALFGSEDYYIKRIETSPKTIYVDDDIVDDPPNHKWDTIQEGINDANDGDTVVVYDGIYKEDVKLNKSINLTGRGYPTIDGGIQIEAINCNVEGFNIVNAWYGISYNGWGGHEYPNITIQNNIISNCSYYGMRIDWCNGSVIQNNKVFECGCGVWVGYGSDNLVKNNTVLNCTEGILLWEPRPNNVLRDNKMNNNEYNFGVEKAYFPWDWFIQDIDTSNKVNGKPIYYLVEEQDKIIDKATNAGFVATIKSENITVKDLTLKKNGEGVLFVLTNNSTITNITLSQNIYGIILDHSNNNGLSNNNCSNNGYGINLMYSSNNAIYLNNFINNTDNVYSYASTNIWNSTEKITYTYKGSTYTNYLGNYWDDYTDVDANNDGIWDHPHSIDGDKDNYPLVERFENYTLISIKAPAVWLYDIENMNITKVVDNLTKMEIKTVFLSTKTDNLMTNLSYTNKINNFIKKAHSNDLYVHAMILESGACIFNISDTGVYTDAKSQTEKIVEYNTKFENKFDGIHVDAEPSQLFNLSVTPPSSPVYKIVRGIVECPICHKKHNFTNNWENNSEFWKHYVGFFKTIHDYSNGLPISSAEQMRFIREQAYKDCVKNDLTRYIDAFVPMCYVGDVYRSWTKDSFNVYLEDWLDCLDDNSYVMMGLGSYGYIYNGSHWLEVEESQALQELEKKSDLKKIRVDISEAWIKQHEFKALEDGKVQISGKSISFKKGDSIWLYESDFETIEKLRSYLKENIKDDRYIGASIFKYKYYLSDFIPISIKGGCEDYQPLNVFFRDTEIPVKHKLNKREYTFVGERWEDRNGNLIIEEDEFKEISDFSKTTDRDEFNMKIPENIPIGLYKLRINGTDHMSNYFWIIFNATDSGLSEGDLQNYWKDEVTGDRVGILPKVRTSHRDAELMICMASASYSAGYDPDIEFYAIENFEFWLYKHLNAATGVSPPSDIISYVNEIKSGRKPYADCDCFASFGVSLARAAGIPAREILGFGIKKSLNPFDIGWAHNWVEPYYYGAWQVWDPSHQITFEKAECLPNSHYFIYTEYLIKHDDLLLYIFVNDELGKGRWFDYWLGESMAQTMIHLSCPVNTTITDQYGRTISDDGTNEIPNASMLVMNDTKIFYLPANLTYTTEIDAYDTGTFNFTRVSPVGNNISITKFENISITASTEASVEILPNVTNYTMRIDYDGDGEIDEEKSPDVNETIEMNKPPTASFTHTPENPVINQSITFNASSSYDPDGTIVSYEWDFGDGNVTKTTEETINHSYSEAGRYTVNLTVTDNDCLTNSITKNVLVGCGDLNSDGEISMTDVHLLLKHVGGHGDYEAIADVNCDGVVDMGDVILLLNHVGDPERYPIGC